MELYGAREAIAREIRAEMARQCKAQADLAPVLEIDQGSVSLRLRGFRSFRAEELVVIADWLGVPVAQLVPAEAAVA